MIPSSSILTRRIASRLPEEARSVTSSIYLSTAPWLAFMVADRSSGLGSTKAAMLAVVVATIQAVGGLIRSERDPIVLLALPLFAGLAAMPWLIGVNDLHRYYRALSLLALGVALGVSIRLGPWSVVYTRRHCRPSSRNSPRFLDENRRLTTWWSVCAVAAAASMAAGARAGGTYWPTLCN